MVNVRAVLADSFATTHSPPMGYRSACVVLVLLGGCTGAEDSFAVQQAQLANARIADLEQRFAAQQSDSSTAGLLMRVAALEAKVAMPSAPPKAPHLVAFKGAAYEKDLGLFVDWQHGYSSALGAYYWLPGAIAQYASTDCSGTEYSSGGGKPTEMAAGPDGTIWSPGAAIKTDVLSQRRYGAACEKRAPPLLSTTAYEVVDTGVLGIAIQTYDLAVDLR